MIESFSSKFLLGIEGLLRLRQLADPRNDRKLIKCRVIARTTKEDEAIPKSNFRKAEEVAFTNS
jgi:hypothetical protein